MSSDGMTGPHPKGFTYWARHPAIRIVNITAITLLNCVLFLKDPIAHSPAEAELPVLGPAMKFMFYHYAYLDAWGMIFKTIFALVYLAVGLFFGKYVLHDFLFRNRFE